MKYLLTFVFLFLRSGVDSGFFTLVPKQKPGVEISASKNRIQASDKSHKQSIIIIVRKLRVKLKLRVKTQLRHTEKQELVI